MTQTCPVPATLHGCVEIAHGGGGRLTQRLLDDIFRPAFAADAVALQHDGATLPASAGPLAFTTDSYVVRPLFFPGGDIGSLAVNGTVNDLAMCGAEPTGLSAGFILEEGLPLDTLRRVVDAMRDAAAASGVRIVTGDTKVVERGKGDGVYLAMSGVGRVIAPAPIGPDRVLAGDVVLLSGDIARHGIAVMAAREELGFETPIESDCAPLIAPVRALLGAGIAVHCLRDLTRGGLATALIEIARTRGVTITLDAADVPVAEPVAGACEILGLDPLYVANEGRFVAIVPAGQADAALSVLRRFRPEAAIIGTVGAVAAPGTLLGRTLGGLRVLDLLTGEQLPRIC